MAEPYTAEQYAQIAQQLGDAYAQAEAEILRILARDDLTSWSRAFRQQQLSQIRAIMERLATETDEWIEYHLPTLYDAGKSVTRGARGRAQLQPPGVSVAARPGQVSAMELTLTALDSDAVAIIAENMATSLGEARAYVGQRIEQMVARAGLTGMETQLAIRDSSLQVMQAALIEGQTRPQAGRALLADLKQRGITSFVDRTGREWDMRAYTEMVSRTTAREAVVQGTVDAIIEDGGDLVEVSSHGGSCEVCAPWEGEILSLTGKTPGYSTLADAEADGLLHPNCAHSLLPYDEGYARAGRRTAGNRE